MANEVSESTESSLSSDAEAELTLGQERRPRIYVMIVLFSCGIMIFTVGIFALSMLKYLEEVSRTDLKNRGKLTATSIEATISQDVALDDRFAVVERCQTIVADNEDLHYVVVNFRDGASLVHQGTNWAMDKRDDWAEFEEKQGNNSVIMKSPYGEDEVLHYAHQLTYLNSLSLGWVHVGISTKSYRENVSQFKNRILFMAFLSLGFGIPASFIFSRQFTQPITRLQQFALAVAGGDLDAHVRAGGSKEIYHLAQTLNWMTRRLSHSRETLKNSLEQEGALREKEILLREIHHRVKNNMQILGSLIRLQCRTLSSSEARQVLIESETRIRSMALLHQKLYQSEGISEIAFTGYVDVLVGELRRLYSKAHCKIAVNIRIDEEFRIGLDTALPCGLIINELVSNSFKYAWPMADRGEVTISIIPDETDQESFVLEVRDDGVGLPADFDLANSTSLGLKLVNMLVEQLEGEIMTNDENGSVFTMHLAKCQYKERLKTAA